MAQLFLDYFHFINTLFYRLGTCDLQARKLGFLKMCDKNDTKKDKNINMTNLVFLKFDILLLS